MDPRRVAELIRITADNLRKRTPRHEEEPARSILIAFESLAKVFDIEANLLDQKQQGEGS
jgi:hypothetical protein